MSAMTWSNLLGFASLVLIVGVVYFAFRQGEKVRKPPEGTPPEHTGGGFFG
jgi:hypothetical protein